MLFSLLSLLEGSAPPLTKQRLDNNTAFFLLNTKELNYFSHTYTHLLLSLSRTRTYNPFLTFYILSALHRYYSFSALHHSCFITACSALHRYFSFRALQGSCFNTAWLYTAPFMLQQCFSSLHRYYIFSALYHSCFITASVHCVVPASVNATFLHQCAASYPIYSGISVLHHILFQNELADSYHIPASLGCIIIQFLNQRASSYPVHASVCMQHHIIFLHHAVSCILSSCLLQQFFFYDSLQHLICCMFGVVDAWHRTRFNTGLRTVKKHHLVAQQSTWTIALCHSRGRITRKEDTGNYSFCHAIDHFAFIIGSHSGASLLTLVLHCRHRSQSTQLAYE